MGEEEDLRGILESSFQLQCERWTRGGQEEGRELQSAKTAVVVGAAEAEARAGSLPFQLA